MGQFGKLKADPRIIAKYSSILISLEFTIRELKYEVTITLKLDIKPPYEKAKYEVIYKVLLNLH